MQWFKNVMNKLFRRKNSPWDAYDYGKPSSEGDDFRRTNEV